MDGRRSLKKACVVPAGNAYTGKKKRRRPPEALAAEQTAERSVGAEQTAPKGGIRTHGEGGAANAALQGGAGTSKGRLELAAPSAGAAETKLHQYDVFLNHRGPDVKKTFVAHLNGALERNGFRPFLDAKSIGQGRHVFSSIDKALKGSCVHVAVFSKRYAESKYCLDELCDMLRSGQRILPVFYDVEPEALRRIEEGPFREGFEKHKRRGRIAEVEKWKEALGKVADLRGFRMDEVNGDEAQLIRSIVKQIRCAIPPTLLGGKQRYGMGGRMKDVLKMLDGVSVLSLVGTGGIGKTTLAMEIYNHFVSGRQFEKHCFLKDVRSRSKVDVSQLQKDLMAAMGHGGGDLTSTSEYERMFGALGHVRVLIIVDDIDDRSQFEALIPDIGKLGVGSLVVITSRYRDVVMQATAGVEQQRGLYDVPPLGEYDSRCLFNRNAFLSETPSDELADLAAKVADACGGHALSLEIVGASLYDKKEPKDKVLWLEAAKALQRNGDIFGKLRSSYDSLPSDGERSMFRDIACMMIGMEEDLMMTIWESCKSCPCSTSKTPAMSLRRLVDRSLVKIDSVGKLRMHDVLRDMGRDIVEKEARRLEQRTHLWDVSVVVKVLSCKQSANYSIRGMCLAWSEEVRLNSGILMDDLSELANMKELHLLTWDLSFNVSSRIDFPSWLQEVRWLQLKRSCLKKLPSPLKLPSLVVLDLQGNEWMSCLWDVGDDIKLPLLQILILTRSWRLKELPENVGESLPKLKRLLLDGCWNLQRLPDSIGHMTDLEYLDLSRCRELVSLPDGIARLLSLRTLRLNGCGKVRQLPEELGNMSNLETLDAMFCGSLSELPTSMGGLKMLTMLALSETKIECLPMDFGQLSSLARLFILAAHNGGLHSIPGSFGGLQGLFVLHLSVTTANLGCMGALIALREFHLTQHATITTLPKCFGNLKCLLYLKIERCEELLSVEVWPAGLEHLVLHCKNLTTIPSFTGMKSLLHLDLCSCQSLKQLQGLECLLMLEYVDLSNCISVVGQEIRITGNSALQVCHLGGSKVGVLYNSRWLEVEHAKEFISCWGNAIPILTNGISHEVVCSDSEWKLVVEASILEEGECVAVFGCFIVQGKYSDIGMRIEVERHGRLVVDYELWPFINHVGHGSKLVLCCTLRRNHKVVQALQYGDVIRILARDFYGENMTVCEGGMCVVHHEDEHFIFMENSKVLSKTQSTELARQFDELVLEDVDYE